VRCVDVVGVSRRRSGGREVVEVEAVVGEAHLGTAGRRRCVRPFLLRFTADRF
jgi:hypothetical protein